MELPLESRARYKVGVLCCCIDAADLTDAPRGGQKRKEAPALGQRGRTGAHSMNQLVYDGDDGSSSQSDNSTCSLMTSCTQCIDWATGCLWCSVPKDSPGFGRGVCLPRLQAQDSCEIGELQVKAAALVHSLFFLFVLLSIVVWNVVFISGNVCQPIHVVV